MKELIKSVKALGEAITGEKIEGDTLFEAVKDAGEKMTGKELEGKELNDIIAETAEDYHGGGGGGDIVIYGPEEASYRVNWQSVVDFMQDTLGIDVDAPATSSQGILVPLFMCSYPYDDRPWYTEATVNLQIYVQEAGALIGVNSDGSYYQPDSGTRGLYFDGELPTIGMGTTIKEAILALPTTLTRSSDGYNYMLMPYFDMVKIEE